jgi:hypothetical protein
MMSFQSLTNNCQRRTLQANPTAGLSIEQALDSAKQRLIGLTPASPAREELGVVQLEMAAR